MLLVDLDTLEMTQLVNAMTEEEVEEFFEDSVTDDR